MKPSSPASSFFWVGLLTYVSSACCDSILLRNATIVTWNDIEQAVQILNFASVLIQDDQIINVYTNGSEMQVADAEVIDASDKIIVPGFVNTHQHNWQTVYKTLGSNISLAEYFPQLSEYGALSFTLSADEIYQSQLAGCLELLSEGTTSWIDHAHASFSNDTVDAMLLGTLESGGRSFFAPAIHKVPNYPLPDQFAKVTQLALNSSLQQNTLVSVGLAYDLFENSDSGLKEAVLDLVRSTNLSFITAHYVGGVYGEYNTPQILHSWGLLNTSLPIILAHASHLTPLDASLLRQTDQYISTTPESELHYGHGNPLLHRIQDQASLGSDTHFTFSASIVGQARMWLQTLRGRLYQQQVTENWINPVNNPMSVNQAFYLATRAGALALRRRDLGIITPGAKADLVIYDTSAPAFWGWSDPVAAVILHSSPGDITDVMVGGTFVKRNGRSTFDKTDQLRATFEASARRVQERYQTLNYSMPASELGPLGRALEIDVVRGNATGY